MIVWILRFFGIPIVTLEQRHYLIEAEEEEDEDTPAVGGGSAHNFTLATPYVDERYEPWEEDRKKFGFRRSE